MTDGILPCREELLEQFDYCSRTGTLIRKSTGVIAFVTKSTDGYLKSSINNSRCYAHRVIWKMVTGEDPDQVDHINGDKTDNRFSNLRSCTKSGNAKNRKTPSNNTSGTIGVAWNKAAEKWTASIVGNGKRIVKYFEDFEAAKEWRSKREADFGYHTNHGRTQPTN